MGRRPKIAGPLHRTWAELMRRVFDLDVLECPACGGRRRLIALINDPPVIRDVLVCLGHDPDPPQRAPPAFIGY